MKFRPCIAPWIPLLLLLVLPGAAWGQLATYAEGGKAFEAGDHAVAFSIWKPLAETGDPRAQYAIAGMYEDGLGIEANEVSAAYWLERAAESGLAIAQFRLGNAYRAGDGYHQDDAEAVRWWQMAAAQGSSGAMYNLGVHYYYGRGVEQDRVIAFEWFFKAADAGHEQALKLFANEALRSEAEQLGEQQAGAARLPPADDTMAGSAAAASPAISGALPGGDKDPPALTATAREGLLGAEWIRAQDPDHFTIQLAAMSDMDGVQRYIDQYGLEGELAVFERGGSSNTMLILIYGSFQDAGGARAVEQQLPEAIRALQVWPRPFAEIQALLDAGQ